MVKKVRKGLRKSWKIIEGYRRSFPDTEFTYPVRKVMGWWVVVACRIIVSAPILVPFLWFLDFRLWCLDLDLDLGLGHGLDKSSGEEKENLYNKGSVGFSYSWSH